MNTNTFTTVNGTTFTTNESGTYFYATWTENGKQIKKRIKKAEYEQAKREHELEVESRMHENINKLCGDIEITEEDIERDARELEQYLQDTEESNTDEAVDEIAEQMLDGMEEDLQVSLEEYTEELNKVEKEKKVRKAKKAKAAKKNAAFSMDFGTTTVTLTEKQVDFIRHFPDTHFWENGLDSSVWIDCLCDDIKGQFQNKPMTVGAMISTLCEKGLGERGKMKMNGRKATYFQFTEMGKAVAKELGLR